MLETRDQTRFPIHPRVMPFYEIARRECGLSVLPVAQLPLAPLETPSTPLPPLEVIDAPLFVDHRYRRLQERRSLSVTFYPFQQPSILVTDARQEIEVFCRVIRSMRFASIIGEHIEVPVDPVPLYRELSRILYGQGAGYVEVIIDAADVTGVTCLLEAGYLPCAYFPCLRRRQNARRDYVILSRSFEAITFEDVEVNPVYLEYLRAYLDGLRRSQVPARWMI